MYFNKNSYQIFDDVMWDLLNNPKAPDCFGIILGGNGKGKSNCGQAIGYDLDKTFGIERIVFEKIEWDLLKPKLKRGNIVVFDEGINFFFSRNAMTTDTKESVQEMVKIRSMGLWILVCIPNLRLLDWYIKGDRPHFIIQTNSPKFKLWSFMENENQTEEEAYVKLQTILKFGLNSVEPDFKGKWNKVNGIKWEKYEEKKRIHQIGTQKNIKIIKIKLAAKEERRNCWTFRDIAEEKGVIVETVRRKVHRFVPKKYIKLDFDGKYLIKPKGKAILDKKWNERLKRKYRRKRRRKRPFGQTLKKKKRR